VSLSDQPGSTVLHRTEANATRAAIPQCVESRFMVPFFTVQLFTAIFRFLLNVQDTVLLLQ
jgi:hypothetical protein